MVLFLNDMGEKSTFIHGVEKFHAIVIFANQGKEFFVKISNVPEVFIQNVIRTD